MSDQAFPIISVPDLRATQRFYEKLGFAETYRFPADGDPAFVTMSRGSSSIGIGARTEDDEAFAYWVYVPDVDDALADLTEADAPVVAEPEDQPWGERVARTRDPAGNMVILGAAISS